MREVQHLALDRDKWTNELVEEALQDRLKKYAASKKATRVTMCVTGMAKLAREYPITAATGRARPEGFSG